MKQILCVLRWVGILWLAALCGCATVGSQPAIRYRVTVKPIRYKGMVKAPLKEQFLVYVEALANESGGGYKVVALSSKTVTIIGKEVDLQLESADYVLVFPDKESCSVVLNPKKDQLICVAKIRRAGRIVAEIEFDVDSRPVEVVMPDFRR